jgi:pyrroloquinoline quinone biosynthesis protein B
VFEEITQTMALLQHPCRCGVHWHLLAIAGDQQMAAFQVPGHEGLEFTAFDAALSLHGAPVAADVRPTGERIAIGMRDRSSGRSALYLRGPGASALQRAGALEGLHCLLLDPGIFPDEAAYESMAAWMAALPIPRKLLLGPVDASHWAASAWPGLEVPADGCDIEF